MAAKREPVVGAADLLDKMDELARAGSDISPAASDLGRLWASRMESVFASDGGGRWSNFAPSTIREHKSPLVDEGVMRDGMTRSIPRHKGQMLLAFGPPKHSRRIQGVATLNTVGHRSRGSRMVPPRPVVPPLSAGERRQWIGAIEEHIREALR